MSPTGRVAGPGFHTHLVDGDTPGGNPLHTHDGDAQAVGHAIDPAHSHEADAGPPSILHNHVFHEPNGHSIRLKSPRAHRHAEDDDDGHVAAGNPLHLHVDTNGVLGAPGGPYTQSHAHTPVDDDLADQGGGRENAAPLHVHKANADVLPAATHKHALAPTEPPGPTGSSAGHTHSARCKRCGSIQYQPGWYP